MSIDKEHYSYAVYADKETAEGFEKLRFGGPIGEYMRYWQDKQLERWITEPKGRRILDVGAGTGRTAIPLALAGAEVTAVDASDEMLMVARRNAEEAGAQVTFRTCDVMDLPFDDAEFDTIMCFRVLLHIIDWKKGLSELCRTCGDQLIIDYPARWAMASFQVPVRKFRAIFDPKVQCFRLFSLRQIRKELKRNGFEIERVEKLWVFPIAFHKVFRSPGFTRFVEKVLAIIGLRRLFGAPVTVMARRI